METAINASTSADLFAQSLRRLEEATLRNDDLAAIRHEVLTTCMALLGADKGTHQIVEGDALKIVAQVGFEHDFTNFFQTVMTEFCVCGMAFKRRQRIVVEDIFTDRRFSDIAPLFTAEGISAVQSTPLFDSRGEPFGVFSTHFRRPHVPTQKELCLLDLYLQRAAPVIEARGRSS